MNRNATSSYEVIYFMLRTLSRPGWMAAIFIFLTCLVPFAGSTGNFRGDPSQELDPFGFSLLTPSRQAFGPPEMLWLAALFMIPLSMIEWIRIASRLHGDEKYAPPGQTVAIGAIGIYLIFLILSVPILAQSSLFPGPRAVLLTLFDSALKASALAMGVKFAIDLTANTRMIPLSGFLAAGVLYFGLSLSDAFLIPPSAREFISPGWTVLIWHIVVLVATVTLHALPLKKSN